MNPLYSDLASELTPSEWLSLYFAENGISYDYKTDGFKDSKSVIDERILSTKISLELSKSGLKTMKAQLQDLLVLWRHEQEGRHIDTVRRMVQDKSETKCIERWIKAVTGETSDLDIAIARHFIWQIKRKIFALPVEHHIMPVLFGKSGGGKSVGVKKLIDPLRSIAMETDMAVFHDRLGMKQFARNFIMFFDELSGANGVEVNRLKQVITADVLEFRAMRSEGIRSLQQNCTFIGCSNLPLRERIKDPTSARRFWQFNCADKLDWEAINNLDYLSLWREVSHLEDCPIGPHLAEIQRIQSSQLRAVAA